MKAHELAEHLLKCPNLPVYINGWGSDEGGDGAEVLATQVGQATNWIAPMKFDGYIDVLQLIHWYPENHK